MRKIWRSVFLRLAVFLGIAMLSARSSASDPPLSPLAVTFRDQLQHANTMRFFVTASIPHFPSRFLVHFRSDGALVLDGPGNFLRYTWDGTTLWKDQHGGPPPQPVVADWVRLIPSLWTALREDSSLWLSRGPAFYGWAKPSGEYAEVRIPDPDFAAWHVFISFARGPDAGPRRLDVYPPAGDPVHFGIVKVDVNPPLPPQVFSKDAPPVAIPFPKICGGAACPGPPFPEPPANPPPPP